VDTNDDTEGHLTMGQESSGPSRSGKSSTAWRSKSALLISRDASQALEAAGVPRLWNWLFLQERRSLSAIRWADDD